MVEGAQGYEGRSRDSRGCSIEAVPRIEMPSQLLQVVSYETLSTIGTLLFSAVPVQAFETYDEYVNACISSEETQSYVRDLLNGILLCLSQTHFVN